MTWNQIDFETGLIDFNAPDRPVTKKRRAVVPMNGTLRAAIEDARQLARTDHVIEYNGRPIAKINDSFRRACQRAGLDNVTPHDLRRTGGTWAAMAGIDLHRIAEMMGHDDIGITRRVYAKFHPDYLRDVVEALEG